tara:strand:- start:1765 stop:2922 length:1158 start_codon:yes stop_codon:yes gene_type:complete
MKDKLIIDLYNKNCLQFGEFKLKSGKTSPIYINLKNVISYPYILNTIVELLYEKIKLIDYTHVLGIPYGAIPFASVLSSKYNIPMLMMRKEMKKYGLKKLIEGEYTPESKLIVLEDTITTGSSLHSFIEQLETINLKPVSVITICDRRTEFKLLSNYTVLSLFTIDDIVRVLYKHKLIETKIYRELYSGENPTKIPFIPNNPINISKVIDIITLKQNQMCYIVEYTDYELLEDFVENNYNKFCVLKIYSNTIENFTPEKGRRLKTLALKYNFLIYDGYNFNTSKNTFFNELTLNNKFYEWVDIINVTFHHDDEVFKTIKFINHTQNKNIAVVYEGLESTTKIKHLLTDIVIGTTRVRLQNVFRFGYNNCDIYYKHCDGRKKPCAR